VELDPLRARVEIGDPSPAHLVEHEHQHLVVVDDALADDFVLVEHVDDAAVERALHRLVEEPRARRAEGGVPRGGERLRGAVLAQLVRAVGRHCHARACGTDATGQTERLDEAALLGGGPAVVSRAGRGRGEIGCGHGTVSKVQPASLWQIRFV